MTDMYECKIDLVICVTSTERKIKITGRIVLCLLTPHSSQLPDAAKTFPHPAGVGRSLSRSCW